MIKYCKKCLFPNTKPDLFFDDNGICDSCNSADIKHGTRRGNNKENIDWNKRRNEFDQFISLKLKNKNSDYDCLVPVSGGKDSTWQVYVAKKILKLNVLAITFDQFDQTDVGVHNLKVLKEIGVDHFHITMNPLIIKKLVKKGLEIIGDPYWVNHVGMFTIPLNIASKFSIPIILYGENPQFEYGGPLESRSKMAMDKRWRQEFSGMRGLREEDMVDHEIKLSDLSLLKYPEISELKKSDVSSIFLGYFMKWDPLKHTEFVKTLGWKALSKPPEGSWLDYENCDMKFIDIRERIKYLKYGYGRATDQLNIAIRMNEMSRAQALSIVKKIDGKVDEKNLINFADYLELNKEELVNIIESFVNHDIFTKNKTGEFTEKVKRY